MDFDTVIRNRKSVRKFRNKKVNFRYLMDAIDAALQGPYPDNHNHLKFLIVEDKTKIVKIAEQCEQNWIQTAPVLIVVCSDDSHLEKVYDLRGRVYSRQTAGSAIHAVLLKLTDLKVGSCWVGAYSDKGIKKILEIPDEVQVEAVIPVGFSEDKKEKSKKADLERVLFWEKWRQSRRPTGFEEAMHDYTQDFR
jgi:nitroreductase